MLYEAGWIDLVWVSAGLTHQTHHRVAHACENYHKPRRYSKNSWIWGVTVYLGLLQSPACLAEWTKDTWPWHLFYLGNLSYPGCLCTQKPSDIIFASKEVCLPLAIIVVDTSSSINGHRLQCKSTACVVFIGAISHSPLWDLGAKETVVYVITLTQFAVPWVMKFLCLWHMSFVSSDSIHNTLMGQLIRL